MLQADEYNQGISAHLSSVLHDLGINEIAIKRRRMLFSNKSQTDSSSDIKVYKFGSQTEALTTLDFQSDLETKLCDTRINIIQDSSEINPELVNISIMFDDNDPPGYCRLQAHMQFLASEKMEIEYMLQPNVKLTTQNLSELSRNAFQLYVYGIDESEISYRDNQSNTQLLEYYEIHNPYIIYRYGRDAFIENRWFQIRSEGDTHGPVHSNSKADTRFVPSFYNHRKCVHSWPHVSNLEHFCSLANVQELEEDTHGPVHSNTKADTSRVPTFTNHVSNLEHFCSWAKERELEEDTHGPVHSNTKADTSRVPTFTNHVSNLEHFYSWTNIRSEVDIHGPANSNTKADTSLVPAFTCLGRVSHRLQNYPEYFVVPVGHSHSENVNIQWRIDTSLAERNLMFGLNVTQIRCYVILKVLMDTYLNSYVRKGIPSYIVKSLLFYMIELKNEEFWSDRNLMLCIKTLLNLLKIFVWSNNFPDYFIRKRNLMEGKLDIQQRVLLFCQVQELEKDIIPHLLGISSCNFGKKLLLKCSSIRYCFPSETYYLLDEEGRSYKTMQEIELIWNMGKETKALVLEECQRICTFIQNISDKILLVWPAYDAIDDTKLGFVVNTTEEVNIKINYRIYQKVVGVYGGGERGVVENHSNPNTTPLHQSQAEKLRVRINQHASSLFQKHRFISGISGSGSRSAGLGARNLKQVSEPCIVIYVLVKGKIPINERQIQKKLGGIPVDIREANFQTCAFEADKYHNNLRMGCQIVSTANVSQVGTLGGFVEHKDYGLCGLTCAHVVLKDEYLHECRGKRTDLIEEEVLVYQPDTESPEHKVGHLRVVAYRPGGDSLPGVDLAMFQIESRPPETGMFPKHSDSENNLLYESGKVAGEKQLRTNQEVFKFGRTTGLTEGCVEFLGTAVRKINFDREYTVGTRFTYTLFNQLEIRPSTGKPFCEGGDSGALVFKRDVTGDLSCIGMVVGKNSNGNGVVTPISAIMNELGVSDLKTFTLNRIDRQFNRLEQILLHIAGTLNINIPT